MHRWLASIVGTVSLCATLTVAAQSPVRFEKDVLPILTQRCGSCHGRNEPEAGLSFGDLKAATKELESGTRAIVPGKPDESELLRRVTSSDESERMPSKGAPLAEAEIEALTRWIEGGAPWPEHWAYRELIASPVPEERVQGSGFRVQEEEVGGQRSEVGGAIDGFVLRELVAKGLGFSPPADKRTLLRRVSFDLVGLPPTPDELDAFLADHSPDAYDRIVDRLLASPRHGERWARHWMDVVHYAETHGHDQDRPRENAWPYRDYLIRAFNADVPYGRFIEEQIAGDVLWPEDTSAIVATGFLATGPWDESSLRDIREDSIDREIGRYLDRDDIVSTVVNTFLSTTVQCARCHDHKFDPIFQQEYYGLQAVFAATDKANRAYDVDPAVAAKRRELIAVRSKLRQQKEQLDPALFSAEMASEVAEWEKSVTAAASLWQVLTPAEVKSDQGSTLTIQSDGSVLSGGTRPEKDTYTLAYSIGLPASGGREAPDGADAKLGPAGNQGADAPRSPMITGLRLEVLTDPSLPKQGPGRQDNGNLHLNELVVKVAPKDEPNGATSLKLVNPRADFDQQGWSIDMALDGNEATAWGIFPEVGKPHAAIFELAEPMPIAGESALTVELKQLHGGGHLIGRPRISVTSAARPIPIDAPSLPAEVASILTTPSDQRTDRQRADLAAFVLNLKYDRLLAALPPRQFVYAGTSDFQPDGSFKPADKPRAVHVLKRGDIHQPGEAAVPSGLSVMPKHGGALSITDASHEGQRRAALAKWIASPANGLTWRSIANRLWHYHFGRGLVDTPNDFGRMGSFPSHPELLDWLAAELRDHGGELRRLHRRMVTSATYRQESEVWNQESESNPQSAIRNPQSIDADNRLLWRMNRARLDAESIHDAVAAISGTLDRKMGGPSVRQFIQTPGIHVTPNVDYQGFNVDDPANYRRSVYRFIFRTLPDPFMESLDCADSSQLTPVRSASVTALQALAMLNDKFIVRQSEHLAERLARDAATDMREQVRLLFRLVLCREPTDEERYAFAAYVSKHGMANACRVLLNSNEFMFVD